ncbi:MAG: chromosome partitioning ATPase [Thermomicrobiales bacterium]|nr:MAG: chromosome partitioning ATPase [Thermomicrobiales bacterium]
MSFIERAAKRLQELRQTSESPFEHASMLDESVRAPEPVAEAVPAPRRHSRRVEIDVERLGRLGMVTPLDPKSRVAEEFRVIKRPILRNVGVKGAAPVADANLVMVTSALAGEGKSTTSVNLAMSIAMELDHTVLLVDADVSRPTVPSMLGISEERGLLDLLTDETLDVSDVLLRTNIEKLSVLPAGLAQSRATELLSSVAMCRLLKDLATRYSDRIIIFDSPPLLPSNESRALATLMGQIVVVVAAESTTHAALKQALATIETCPVKLLMLNKSRVSSGTGYGNYGSYGYGYGSQSV